MYFLLRRSSFVFNIIKWIYPGSFRCCRCLVEPGNVNHSGRYEGHAVSLVKYGNLFAKCDRSQNDLFIDNVVIFQITRPQILTKEFIKSLMYKRQTKHFFDVELPHLLGLKRVDKW